MAGIELKLRQDFTPMPDADPILGSVSSEVARYLASFAMTAVATLVAVGVDSKVMIPNLSLVFVVPVIIAGVSLGLGHRRLGDTWSAGLQLLPYRASLHPRRRRPGKYLGDRPAVCRRTHRQWRCVHLPSEGDRGGTVEEAGNCAARLQPRPRRRR